MFKIQLRTPSKITLLMASIILMPISKLTKINKDKPQTTPSIPTNNKLLGILEANWIQVFKTTSKILCTMQLIVLTMREYKP